MPQLPSQVTWLNVVPGAAMFLKKKKKLWKMRKVSLLMLWRTLWPCNIQCWGQTSRCCDCKYTGDDGLNLSCCLSSRARYWQAELNKKKKNLKCKPKDQQAILTSTISKNKKGTSAPPWNSDGIQWEKGGGSHFSSVQWPSWPARCSSAGKQTLNVLLSVVNNACLSRH